MNSGNFSLVRLRTPTLRQVIAYVFIFLIVCAATSCSATDLFGKIGLSLWSHPAFAAKSEEVSSAIIWLAAANAISFVVVLLLWRDLRKVVDAASSLLYKSTNGGHKNEAENTKFVLKPLQWISVISVVVLFVILGLACAPFLFDAKIHDSVLKFAIYWTGLFYVAAMTLCDVAARTSYMRLNSMELHIPSSVTPEYREAAQKNHELLIEMLGDFDRMFWFVDIPILAGVFAIMFHKHFVLSPTGGYYLGFIAGAVAMHTILANLISLVIASTTSAPKQT